jgi:hypothetical protein
MPFGLDVKSIIVGALLVWFGLPFFMQLIGKVSNKQQSAVN